MKLADKIVYIILALVTTIAISYYYQVLTAPEESDESDLNPIETYLDPIQTNSEGLELPVMNFGSRIVSFDTKAQYKIAGVLVSKRRYIRGFMSDVSPWDYALAWKAVPELQKYIKFDQIMRFCLFSIDPDSPVNVTYVSHHFSNNHLIPASKNLRKALKLAKKGKKIELTGYLVNVKAKQPGKSTILWKSSLTRTDEGNGACEIIYLTRLRIDDKVYE